MHTRGPKGRQPKCSKCRSILGKRNCIGNIHILLFHLTEIINFIVVIFLFIDQLIYKCCLTRKQV